jgi:tetratricopeptide (TPR) repeat protein
MTEPGTKPVAATTSPEVGPEQQRVDVGGRLHDGSLAGPRTWLRSKNAKRLWGNVERLWVGAALVWKGMIKLALNVVAGLAFFVTVALFYQILTQRSIVIEPISVPQSLASNGYTPEVAARRLRDALKKYHAQAQTRMKASELALHSERPNFVVPTIGLSFEAITAFVRTFFDFPHQLTISGEFTIAEDRLWLRLRQNGLELYTSTDGVSADNPDVLLALASPKIFEQSEPYIVASALFDIDREKSLQLVERIIADRPKSDKNVVWSYILIGLHLVDQKEYDRAIAQYNKAIELNPEFPTAITNRGGVHHAKGDLALALALADFNNAIRLDSKYATAFMARGHLHFQSNDLDLASRISTTRSGSTRSIPPHSSSAATRTS